MSDAEEAGGIPVLTEVVEVGPSASALDPAAIEALARSLEQAILERLAPRLERLAAQAVREAIAESLAEQLAVPKRD